MRKKRWMIAVLLILGGLAIGGYWYYAHHDSGKVIPDSGIFVMEDSICRHSM